MKAEKRKLLKVLAKFQEKLQSFDEDAVSSWSIEGLCQELDELISQTEEELSDEE